MSSEYRLDQFLQLALGYSRKEAGKLIRKKRVIVNSELITDRDYKVTHADAIYLDDELIEFEDGYRYFVLYKPKGYVSSHQYDGHPPLFRLLDEETETLHIAGRLDADTTGLVLITDDGDWSHRVTHPRQNDPKATGKRYVVTLAKPITQSMIEQLEAGVVLRDNPEPTLPANVEVIDAHKIHLTIYEGRYHQVKRMIAAVGNRVEELHRSAIGTLTLEGLNSGEYRPLTEDEIEGFK